ncbi:MAG: radical SAM protein [Candidatus Omnitrophota bacterium]|jgi:anaerobic magnesium-protoporphyrin IX monomethyl ester cyclase
MDHFKKKAKVLLLNPPTAARSTEIILGRAYLASSRRKAGHEVRVVDATAPYKSIDPDGVKKIVSEYAPHFIGITLTISYIAQTYEYINDLRKMGIPIVAGGSHVNPLPEEALANGVDIVVLGEGENTIVELADYYSGNRSDLDNIRGLCIKREDGSVYRTSVRPLIENLDEIPFPAFEDFPIKNYTGSDDVDSNPIFWAIFSSRGCPFNCIFCCGHNVFGRTYRLRSAQNIFDEIKDLVKKYGVKKIAFQDDEILLSKQRIMDLCNLILNDKLKIKMSLRARIDSIDPMLLRKMQEAGFVRMSFGIESWNNETLKGINKKYDVETIKKGLAALESAKFTQVNFNTIVGFPWEKKAHLRKNIETLYTIPLMLNLYNVVVTPVPYPNTELYNRYHREFGFTNWWLDPEKHWKGWPSKRPTPLFYSFTKYLLPLYKPDYYWNYSAEWRREMEGFCWKVFKLYSKRHMNLCRFTLVYVLIRSSHAIWKVSPGIESFFSRMIPKKFIRNIEKSLSFIKAE